MDVETSVREHAKGEKRIERMERWVVVMTGYNIQPGARTGSNFPG